MTVRVRGTVPAGRAPPTGAHEDQTGFTPRSLPLPGEGIHPAALIEPVIAELRDMVDGAPAG